MDNNKPPLLIRIGSCPICGKGHITQTEAGWLCNYFKDEKEKCNFIIYKQYFNKEITEDIAKCIIQLGETPIYTDFERKDGTNFSAKLKIVENIVKVIFTYEKLQHKCPKCNGDIEVLPKGYSCQNYKNTNGESSCNFYIPRYFCEKEISKQNAELLVSGKNTDFIIGFKNKQLEEFDSRLNLDVNGSLAFNNELCECPKCGGKMFIGKKGYNCSNFKSEIKCDFVIWKEIHGRNISPIEAISLCQNKETNVLKGFKNIEGTFSARLVIDENYKVKYQK